MKVRDPDVGGEGWAAAEFLVAWPLASARMQAAGRAGDLAETAELRSLTPNQLTDGATLTRREAFAARASRARSPLPARLAPTRRSTRWSSCARRVGWTSWDGMAARGARLICWLGWASRPPGPRGRRNRLGAGGRRRRGGQAGPLSPRWATTSWPRVRSSVGASRLRQFGNRLAGCAGQAVVRAARDRIARHGAARCRRSTWPPCRASATRTPRRSKGVARSTDCPRTEAARRPARHPTPSATCRGTFLI